ncbi:hypothetical protein [Alkalihalobacterium elongatum]|uniref:hypothetical protein n=1 Tax=Alkalihalobacterium elongatum TaxID=2675466 RepID=UPI001C1F7688|nr:hypothetical protein [Alkalihalobacterium elongatum]
MPESRIMNLEKRIEQFEKLYIKDKEFLIEQLDKTQVAIQQLKQAQTIPTAGSEIEASGSFQKKIEYLTAANEQMFQQNKRLREFIEDALEKNEPLVYEDYYKALRGD